MERWSWSSHGTRTAAGASPLASDEVHYPPAAILPPPAIVYFLRSLSRLASLNSVRIRTDALTIELVDEAQVREQLKTMIGSKEPRAWELCAGQSVPVRWARGALWSIVAPFGSSGEPEVGPNPYKKLSIALFRAYHIGIIDRGSSLQASMAERE
jgi:hypothetical protein